MPPIWSAPIHRSFEIAGIVTPWGWGELFSPQPCFGVLSLSNNSPRRFSYSYVGCLGREDDWDDRQSANKHGRLTSRVRCPPAIEEMRRKPAVAPTSINTVIDGGSVPMLGIGIRSHGNQSAIAAAKKSSPQITHRKFVCEDVFMRKSGEAMERVSHFNHCSGCGYQCYAALRVRWGRRQAFAKDQDRFFLPEPARQI